MEIGEKIKELRIERGLTQEELADRAELSKGFISQVERDLTSPSIATLEDIVISLGTDTRHSSQRRRDRRSYLTERITSLRKMNDIRVL